MAKAKRPLRGRELKAIRLKLNVGKRTFAKYINVGLNCLKGWEAGARAFPVSFRVTNFLLNEGLIEEQVKSRITKEPEETIKVVRRKWKIQHKYNIEPVK